MRTTAALALAHTLPLALPLAAPAQTPPAAPAVTPAPTVVTTIERWKGEIALPGMKLEFSIVVNRPEPPGVPSATMSIPAQGLADADLRDVVVSDERLNFTLGLPSMPKAAWAYFEIQRKPGEPAGKGIMKQSGMEMPVTITRLAEGEQVGPRRPQTPKPPYPYAQREVTYTNPDDNATLAATITIPDPATHGPGPYPAAVLITGSGPQDRDETLFGHKPFAVIADALTRAGVAVLRADDRGVGGSTSPRLGQETTEDFVGDALAAAHELARHPEIDPARIGLIGHSEGGLIAPMAAARAPDKIAFIVLLAGTGVSGREVLASQLRAMAQAAGAPADALDAQEAAQRRAIDAIAGNAPPEAVELAVRALARVQLGIAPDADVPANVQPALDAAVAQGVKQLSSPWMKTFIRLDPADALSKVRCPVLALFGDKDTQVVPAINAEPMRQALAKAGNTRATVEILPNLNHLFQTCTTGAFAEYNQIEETFAPKALERLTTWVVQTTRKPS
ncbi:MAG: alpha/beta fold hydrolase, partial [Phycisphaerae bacterium]|nr:alpha/beta fold hydrolase [Phycisphaerae bacterium]